MDVGFSKQTILELFEAIHSSEPDKVNLASRMIIELQKKSKSEFLKFCSEILCDEATPFSFLMAAICVGQILSPNTQISFGLIKKFWEKEVLQEVKPVIRKGLFRGLMFESEQIRQQCSKSLSIVARVEIPLGQWDDLYEKLIEIIVNDTYGFWSKNGSFQCFTEIFQIPEAQKTMFHPPFDLQNVCLTLLNIITKIISTNDANDIIKISAAKCLNSFLRFALRLFDESNFNNFLQLLSQSLKTNNTTYSGIIFDILNQVIEVLYNSISNDSMKLIFDSISSCMLCDNIEKVEQSIQLCTKIAETEKFIQQSIKMLKHQIFQFHNFTQTIAETLYPKLFSFLSIINEDNEDISLCFVAKDCLNSFARVEGVDNYISSACFTYFQQHFNSNEVKFIFSSILCLFSIVGIQENPFINENIRKICPIIINIFETSNIILIKKYALKLIKSILSHHIDIAQETYIDFMNFSVIVIANNNYILSTSAINILKIIFSIIKNPDIIFSIYENISTLLFQTIQRNDIFEGNFLESVTNCIISFINSIISIEQLQNIFLLSYNKFILSLQVSFNDTSSQIRIQSNLCRILREIILRIDEFPQTLIQEITNLQNILFTLIERSSPIEIDSLNTISALIQIQSIDIIQQNFNRLIQILINGLKNDSPEFVTCVSRLIGDIYKSNHNQMFLQYINNFLELIFAKIEEFIYLPYNSVSLFFAVGDIISVSSDVIINTFSYIMKILRHFIHDIIVPDNDIELRNILLCTLIYVPNKIIVSYPNLMDLKHNKVLLFLPIKKYLVHLMDAPDYIKVYLLTFLDDVLSAPYEITSIFMTQLHLPEIKKILYCYAESPNEHISAQSKKLLNILFPK